VALVKGLGGEWQPEKYKDEYRENLMRVIEAKIKGRRPNLKEAPSGPGRADVVDLMERLRKSLKLSGQRSGGGTKATKATGAATRARKTSKTSKTKRTRRAA
jgi:DNA end-binding protein Ku